MNEWVMEKDENKEKTKEFFLYVIQRRKLMITAHGDGVDNN